MDKAEVILKSLIDNLDEGIQIVDSTGKTIYYNDVMSKMEGLEKEKVIGKKATEYLKGVEDESSTLMNAIKYNKKFVDTIQHYSSKLGKEITTINTTIPIAMEKKIIGAIEISKDMTKLKELNEKICRLQISFNNKNVYSFKDIIGGSEQINKAIDKATKASLSDSSVLIYGETGCGKEVFAQSIHYNGSRKNKPFVPINCAAIPSTLLEGMLFGTVKGSFTGAENKKGIFQEANGGTILLDEVNSMDTVLQSKLLRVLQDGYIRSVGSNSTVDVDVRIIATLNEEPDKLMREGKLRKDFYYRLSVIRIDIPPLRERISDIPIFCKYFLTLYNKILSKNVKIIDEKVLENFMQYEWPGNIRELKNAIEGATNMVEDNKDVLTKEYFDSRIVKSNFDKIHNYQYNPSNGSLESYLDSVEKAIIDKVLLKNEYNITKTARELKISRQRLQYKMKKYNLP